MALMPHQRHQAPQSTAAHTGRVVRSDTSGVWVAPLGGDTRHPIGPCRGATRPDSEGGVEQLPADTLVLLVLTDHGPWVAAHHQEVS